MEVTQISLAEALASDLCDLLGRVRLGEVIEIDIEGRPSVIMTPVPSSNPEITTPSVLMRAIKSFEKPGDSLQEDSLQN